MAQLSAVIVTEDSEFRTAASDLVRASGVPIGVDDAATVDPSKPSPAIALVDGRASAGWGRVEEIRLCWPSATIIAVASESQPDHILAAMRAGANEFGAPQGIGWLGRYLDTLPSPVDPLVAWNTVGQLPRTLQAATVGVPSIPNPATYAFASPDSDAQGEYSKAAAAEISSHLPPTNPHLAFVNSTTQAALATLDRVALVADYTPAVEYPDSGLGQALRAVAGAMVTQVGTQVFWVQTGGFDTHAGQDTATGRYADLLSTLDQAVLAFRNDLTSHGLFDSTMVLQFSEFGRRVSENGSQGTDHGAAGLMMALGGRVGGGLYGTAASLVDTPDNPTLENSGRDVTHETDFRSVYARVIDDWLGASSIGLLGSDFRNSSVDFV